ncbi:alpha/beta hydrolase [Bradyrhizobium sp. STM 3809]|uniref:alpha/beta fold hydrolase n=1 Tax=Bradyrhizobium sp. STM 3809 TaxID=551936 RepID=UPI000240A2B1|nr:alpha/beta hydrolase [Bradyrhizobium sp. STM 3809]CCE02354.1 Arylesterase (Aryl-ester hydrolase) [Bradyrhizobium sp. STM 3809]
MQRRDLLLTAATATFAATGARAAAPETPRSRVRCSDGATLHCEDWGSGRPVLFVHAWALTSAMWTYQMADLSHRGLRCIAFDRRGHGRSDIPGSGYDLDRLADDIAEVIAQCDLDDVALVGMSMGCNEIVNYVARHGTARIARIAMLGPTTPYPLQTADNALGAPKAYFEQSWATWQSDFPKWIEDNKLPFFTPETSPQMMEWVAAMMRQTPIPVAVATNRALITTDLRPVLARIDRPVLILHGDRDVSAPLEMTGRPTVRGIKGAALKIYPGGPHGLFVTHMKQVNADLAAFLA